MIGQHQVGGPVTHRRNGFRNDRIQRLAQRRAITARLLGDQQAVDLLDRTTHVLAPAFIGAIGQDRAVEHQDRSARLALGQDIPQVAEPGLQPHHAAFAQGVDRRVGDLREILPEEVRQRPIGLRQHCQRGVIPHRTDGFLAVLGHGVEHQLDALEGETRCSLMTGPKGIAQHLRFRPRADHGLDVLHLAQPALIGMLLAQLVQDLVLAIEAAFLDIQGDQAARRDLAALDHLVLVDRRHAGFRPGDENAVLGRCIAHRTQAIAIHAGNGPPAIKGGDGSRPVPGLHDRVAVFIHPRPFIGHHLGPLGPGFRDQDRLGHRRRPSGPHQDFKRLVQRRTVGRARLDHRFHIALIAREGGLSDVNLVALHPVDIAADRVDLAIMRQHPEGLGQAPFREGVGGIALVEDGKGRHEGRVLQVPVEGVDILGPEQALVDDVARGERADIGVAQVFLARPPLDASAHDVEHALDRLDIAALGIAEQHLLDFRQRRPRLVTQHGCVDRRLAPAVEGKPLAQDFRLDDRACTFAGRKIGARQEDHADDDIAAFRLVTGARHSGLEEVLGYTDPQASPVAGLAISIHRTAVPDRFQRGYGQFDNLAPRLALHVGDQTDTAGIAFILGPPQARAFEHAQSGPHASLVPGLLGHSAAPRT